MQAVSIQDENLKGLTLEGGDLTPFKSQSSTNTLHIYGNKWFQGFLTWLHVSFQSIPSCRNCITNCRKNMVSVASAIRF